MSNYPKSVEQGLSSGGDLRSAGSYKGPLSSPSSLPTYGDPYADSIGDRTGLKYPAPGPAPYNPIVPAGGKPVTMPYGPTAPVAGVAQPSGAQVSVGDYANASGMIIDGEYVDLTDEAKARQVAQWGKKLLQALGLLGKSTPLGRLLDILDAALLILDLLRQYKGEEWKAPAAWGTAGSCNFPPISTVQKITTLPGTMMPSCFSFQAVTDQFLPNHRVMILWEAANQVQTRWDMLQRWFYSGPLPNPGPAALTKPIWAFPASRNPAMADPMANPIIGAANKPEPIPYPLRASKPNSMFFEQGYGHRPVVQTGGNPVVIFPPKGPPVVVTRPPSGHRPPPRGTRERKFKLTGAAAKAMRVVGTVTEVGDVLDCLHKALPKKYQAKAEKADSPQVMGGPFAKGYFGKGEYLPITPQQKSAAVWAHSDKIDPAKFGNCIFLNHIQDAAIGRGSKAARKATPSRPIGWLAGPAV